MKKCAKCNKQKELTEFYKHGPAKDGYRSYCKECCLEYRNSIGKAKQLKKRYGISIDDYNKMYESQEGFCSICGIHQSDLKVSLAVDHNHDTNKVRSLLCVNCNRGLGFFKDSIENLENAFLYLKRYL